MPSGCVYIVNCLGVYGSKTWVNSSTAEQQLGWVCIKGCGKSQLLHTLTHCFSTYLYARFSTNPVSVNWSGYRLLHTPYYYLNELKNKKGI